MNNKLSITIFTLAGFVIAAVLYFTIRQMLAVREIEAEWKAGLEFVAQLATSSRVEIIPLYEEASGPGEWMSGHGVSYLVRTDSATILLDVGNNPDQLATAPFGQNMEVLGMDWEDLSRIVISHPHPDHVGGINAWVDATMSMGGIDLTGGLDDRMIFVPTPLAYPGAVHVTIPTLPAPDIATTGVISFPEVFPFSLHNSKGSEQALVVHIAGQGLVLITGCGHPGLEKLVERAEALYGQTVIGVVGGMHYENLKAEDVQPHIQFLQSRQPGLVALSPHDSSPEALSAFQSAFGDRYHTLRVGEAIQFP